MNAQQVWLAQVTQAPRVSLEHIRHQASRLERGTRWRAGINHVVSVLVIGIYCWCASQEFFYARPLLLVAMAWYGLFMVYCMYRLHRHVAMQVNPEDAGVLDTLRFHRRQLERQRDFWRGLWRWQSWGLFPGVLLQAAAMVVYSAPWIALAFLIVVSLAMAVGATVGEMRARRSQREIDALDSLAGGG